ncbi:Bacterial regulatory protein, tetR family [compost metagenome]
MNRDVQNDRRRGPRTKLSPETTKELLVRAVGEIMEEEGWQGLGVNKIALRAGVDKKMIYWYFESYNNLLKTYIKSQDFWEPVFRDFEINPVPGNKEIPKFITSIFKYQFNSFYTDRIMQAFIHWQISEPNTLLKDISEERELNGSKIAALADPHFEDSGFNFRAVLALMLGGIYYLVWHSRQNGSTVCGIDINKTEDREAVVRSLGQIVDLIWEAAEKAVPEREKDSGHTAEGG